MGFLVNEVVLEYDARLLEHTEKGSYLKWENLFINLPRAKSESPWVCGGVIRRALLGQKQDADIDYFFRDELKRLQFADDMEAIGAEILYECEQNRTWKWMDKKIQECKLNYFPTIEECLKSFDFTICQFGWDGFRFYVGPYSLLDTGEMRLKVNTIRYQVNTIRRIAKYLNQGFTISNEELAEILLEISKEPQKIAETVGKTVSQ